MTSERWRQVESIYHDALEQPLAERSAWVADACAGDGDLRKEVESLLAQHASVAGTLDDGVRAAAAALVGDESAALKPGRRIGVYDVQAPIGAGGMGEVYRARDTRLDREVAIKILPRALNTDRDRLARFEREARVLASLNHPNIATIHGIEESDGVKALVLELVPGDTLADRIERASPGGLPLEEALTMARQIVDALDAAHGKGVVHRDLKPANIKITPDGLVKVLDFGLAKLQPAGGVAEVSQAPTATIGGTREGVIVGTPAYMSPEQARGQAVDEQTDIWAFGCVLYEMLTGRAAFAAPTISDTVAAILEHDPQQSLLPVETPESTRRLLRRCLAKDKRGRLHDIADARLEIDEARLEPNAEHARTRGQTSSRGRAAWLFALAATAIVAAIGGWSLSRRSESAGLAPALNVEIERLTNDAGVTRMPALSPDGRLLAYASNRAGNGDLDIWVQQVAGGVPLRLTDDPADDSTPDFSPDGSQIVFRSERNGGGVYVVSTLGGPARLLAPDGRRPRFSPDGTRIAFWTGQFRGTAEGAGQDSATYVMPIAGGSPVRVLSEFDVANVPVWRPDGAALLVAAARWGRGNRANVDWWVAPLDGTAPVQTGFSKISAVRGAVVAPDQWTSSGVLFAMRGDIWSVDLDPNGPVSGPLRRLTTGVGPHEEPVAGSKGEIVFAQVLSERAIERASLTRVFEPAVRLYADTGSDTWRASSTADGSRVVFERLVGAAREIWARDTESGKLEMVVRVPTTEQVNATVSADGTRIAYTQSSTGRIGSASSGFVVETASGVPRKLCDGCALRGFLADNQRVLAAALDGHAIRLIDARTGDTRDLVTAGGNGRLDRPHASPDDRWLAFREIRDAKGRTFVVPLKPNRPQSVEGLPAVEDPTTTGRPAGWSLDSSVLYLLLDTDGFRCLWGQRIDPGTGALVGQPFAVRHFHTKIGLSTSFGNAVTAEGFLYETADASANLWKLTSSRQP